MPPYDILPCKISEALLRNRSMRPLARFIFAVAFTTACLRADDLPAFRPALIGNGPDAVINRIDTKALLANGQKDAAVMFSCAVDKAGDVVTSVAYRGTPDSKLLEAETLRSLTNAKMIPAIYKKQPVGVFFYGTVLFRVVDGKPRLRILSNQETTELEREADFVGPQPVIGADSQFTGVHYRVEKTAVRVRGVVELAMNVSPTGELAGMSVATEDPPFLGFGSIAIEDFTGARFIPAFRDGKPVPCAVTLPVHYLPGIVIRADTNERPED